MKKILIIDHVHPLLIDALKAKNYTVDIQENLSTDDFIHLKDEYIGLIMRSKIIVSKTAIDSKSHLKFIARLGSGMEHIDVQYATKKGIHCISSPEGNANSVAEHALGLLISCLKKIPIKNTEVRNGIWDRSKGHEIYDKTIGIIGYGNTGHAFANLLSAFNCQILAYDILKENFGSERIIETDLDTLYKHADIVSLNINYTPENHYFANINFFNHFQKKIILINTSRGQVLNCKDLITCLKNGKIQSAGLDVLEYESSALHIPPKTDWSSDLMELTTLDNVILTPHIAGQTLEADIRHSKIILNKIMALNLD